MRTLCATTVSGECSGGTQRLLEMPASCSPGCIQVSAEFSAIALLPSPEEDEASERQQHRPGSEDQPGLHVRHGTVDEHRAGHVDDPEQRVQHHDLAD